MPRHGPNLYKHASGRWVAVLQLDGGRRKSFYSRPIRDGGSADEAKRKRDAWHREFLRGRAPLGRNPRLWDHCEAWLEETVKPRRAPLTHKRYEQQLRLRVRDDPIGKVRLGDLRPADCRKWVARMGAAGLGPATVNLARAALSGALKAAVADELIDRNPLALAPGPPAGPRKETRFLSVPEARRLLDSLSGKPGDCLIGVALLVGLRKAEALALTWADVDLGGGAMRVRGTKTGASDDTLPLVPRVLALLRKHRAAQIGEFLIAGREWTDGGHLFLNPSFEPLSPVGPNRYLKRALAALGLPPMRFHDLRHSCASLLYEFGVPMEVISRVLRHATPEVTRRVYTHLQPNRMREELERVSRLLGGESGGDSGG